MNKKPVLSQYLKRCIFFFLLLILPFRFAYAVPEDYFISAETVASNPDHYLLIDARAYSEYLKGHIPGARSVQWQSLSDMNGAAGSENWATVLDNKELEYQIQKLGLSPTDNIVVYADAQRGWGEDGRIAWSLHVAGLKNVRILNGGYSHWKEKGLKTTIIPTFFNTKSDFTITQRDSSATIHTKALYRDYSQFRVIDSRSPEEFHGKMDLGEQRKGHLPGAVSLPFQQMFTASGTLKSFDDISRMLSDQDIQKNSPIVVYCTAGIRSAHMVMVLKAAGYTNVRNYTPSFYHWAALSYTPIE
ncbi:rhodanese-like domain-containing protein [Salinisphaera sp. G21_0]|uniref:sulfurtransferase n=1 Tax=Salinisphaera sp. G21_0 TaxID=2821094 RepID=UPI001ADBDD11|nr:rhodanese-like domain-containing protein [Salinisphaera sp. G21_0]MBO9481597.1 sulfurtransferase [Salinisphaera sp. G21_0]